MASPTKPGQRVMVTTGHGPGSGPWGADRIGLVARRLTDWCTEHRWNVRLDSGEVVEVAESDLFLITGA